MPRVLPSQKLITSAPPLCPIHALIVAAHLLHGVRSPLARAAATDLHALPLVTPEAASQLGRAGFSLNMAGRVLAQGLVRDTSMQPHADLPIISFKMQAQPVTPRPPLQETVVYDQHPLPETWASYMQAPEPWMELDLDLHTPFQQRCFLMRGKLAGVHYEPLQSRLQLHLLFASSDFPPQSLWYGGR